MTEVFIENFQSIKNVNFIIDGFTVIVGKNNIGKSAIIRAIDACLSNESGKEFIRKGEKETKVRIKRKNIDIKWIKSDSAIYDIKYADKTDKFSKLNKAIPQPVLDAGFGKILIEDKMVSPMIAHQFDPLFLLNKRGSVITEVLTALYDMDLISIADDKCQKDLKAYKSLLKTREADFKALQTKLKNFEDFENIKKTVKDLTEQDFVCKKLQDEIKDLIKYEQDLAVLEKSINILEIVTSAGIPDYSLYENGLVELGWLISKEKELLTLLTNLERLKEVRKLNIPDTTDVDNLISEIKKLNSWDNDLSDINKFLNKFLDLKDINLPSLLDSLILIEKKFQDFSEIEILEKNLLDVAASIKSYCKDFEEATAELNQKNSEISRIKVCPLCERPLHG